MAIAENLERVREAVAEASRRAGRGEGEVALMAVSKVHPVEALLEAYAAGQRLFGENRVQEFAAKLEQMQAGTYLSAGDGEPAAGDGEPAAGDGEPAAGDGEPAAGDGEPASFHLIGPLQSNKTSKAAEIFDAVDTVDSIKIAQRLSAAAVSMGKTLPVLIEVKLSPEESKHGVDPSCLQELAGQMAELPGLRLSGLMTVPPWSEDPETARPYFRHLRRLRDQLLPDHPGLTELSMGMSGDFAVAIEEGSTTVRLGTAIFGRRPPIPAGPA